MKNFCKVDVHNINKYYNKPDGNLYFKVVEDSGPDYEVVDGFELDELKAALAHGNIELIWVSGEAQAIIKNLIEEPSDEAK